jgi:hypothetical protein
MGGVGWSDGTASGGPVGIDVDGSGPCPRNGGCAAGGLSTGRLWDLESGWPGEVRAVAGAADGAIPEAVVAAAKSQTNGKDSRTGPAAPRTALWPAARRRPALSVTAPIERILIIERAWVRCIAVTPTGGQIQPNCAATPKRLIDRRIVSRRTRHGACGV